MSQRRYSKELKERLVELADPGISARQLARESVTYPHLTLIPLGSTELQFYIQNPCVHEFHQFQVVFNAMHQIHHAFP